MSVFSDFQVAWKQRFPNCDLPSAWIDDVRANLVKHRHKVALLKEELEKEEFYVDYLESLLADVEQAKPSLSIRNINSASTSHNGDHSIADSRDQYVTVITVSSYGEMQKLDQSQDAKRLFDNPLYQDAQSLSLDVASSHVHRSDNAFSSESNVIEAQVTEPIVRDVHTKITTMPNITHFENDDKKKKKRPPTPPRKPKVDRSKYPFLSESSKLESESLTVTETTTVQPKEKDSAPKVDLPTSQSENEINLVLPTDNEVENQNDDAQNESGLFDEDEDIYDTVAPDEVTTEEKEEVTEDENVSSEKPELQHSDSLEMNLSSSNLLSTKYDLNSYSNYVNIDYFLRKEETSSKDDSDNETHLSQSLSSDHDFEEVKKQCSDNATGVSHRHVDPNTTYDEVFEPRTGEYDIASDELDEKEEEFRLVESETSDKLEAERLTMYKCIIASIIESESIYVDCLNTLIQYMKALKSTIGTNHPLLSLEDLNTIFYKIPELHTIHCVFLNGMKQLVTYNGDKPASNQPTVGELFKVLASRLGAYSAFLKNYSKALEAIQKCSSENNQFSEITRLIKLKSLKGQATSLEDLLHKPVARVQKNALVLHDLLKYTPEDHHEYKPLRTALKMTQCFLNDLNIAATEQMFPVQDKTQRRLVKESFIVELSDGKRKLRHLFLFNDVIVCAKYKSSTRQKFTFELKWYMLLSEITLPEVLADESASLRDSSPDILTLKSRVSNNRDVLLKEEEKEKNKVNHKLIEKLRKKQSDLEAQLVLLLPQLPFPIIHKSGRVYMFFCSSEFDRTLWMDAIKIIKSQDAVAPCDVVNFSELQAWIETCRKNLNPSLGSFLLRSSKDEDLLYGDLYLTVRQLNGLSRAADLFFVIELDTYGHFFQKAVTKVCRGSAEPVFDQEFVLDLDGSKVLRILCYEEIAGQPKPLFRGKTTLELCQSWLQSSETDKQIPILDCTLFVTLRYSTGDYSTGRFATSKLYGAFGVNIQNVCKKEKSPVPYLITTCIREVERRGMKEVGVYRVSGLSSDVQRLKKAFETNPYEADQLLKEIDIHAVTGILKLYLRELPDALFTNNLYKKFFEAFNLHNQSEKNKRLLTLYSQLPQVNQNVITLLIEHLSRVNQLEDHNKMSLHSLATIFGPTLIRPGNSSLGANVAESFTAGTIDVMAQAGIFHFFLTRKSSGQTLSITENTAL